VERASVLSFVVALSQDNPQAQGIANEHSSLVVQGVVQLGFS